MQLDRIVSLPDPFSPCSQLSFQQTYILVGVYLMWSIVWPSIALVHLGEEGPRYVVPMTWVAWRDWDFGSGSCRFVPTLFLHSCLCKIPRFCMHFQTWGGFPCKKSLQQIRSSLHGGILLFFSVSQHVFPPPWHCLSSPPPPSVSYPKVWVGMAQTDQPTMPWDNLQAYDNLIDQPRVQDCTVFVRELIL